MQVVSNEPTLFGAYVRVIILDDDTTTSAQLQEDCGPLSIVRLEKCLTGIQVVADPSHPERTYQKHMWELVCRIRKGWDLTKGQSKKLTRNFGFFQSGIRGMTVEEAREVKNEFMHHVIGNHSQCGNWCNGKRAQRYNKLYNVPAIFDKNNPTDQKHLRK